LHAVNLDRVVLARAGVLETLRLPRPVAGTAPTTPLFAPTPPSTPAAPGGGATLPSDPELISNVIRYTPVLEQGQLRGFRVFPAMNEALFLALGLQPGDLVAA